MSNVDLPHAVIRGFTIEAVAPVPSSEHDQGALQLKFAASSILPLLECPRSQLSGVTIAVLQAAALKPRINPGGSPRPQAGFRGEQRVDFKTAQVPALFNQLRKRSLGRTGERAPQLVIRQEAADEPFNCSM